MTRTILLLAVPAAGVAIAIGLFVYSRAKPVSVEDWAKRYDPVLAQLFALNPGLQFEDEFKRLPIYWIQYPVSGGKTLRVMLPKSEAGNARITVGDCDLSQIPQSLLYPRRKETICLEIDNDQHKLRASYFRTADYKDKVVEFYNALLEPDRRFTMGREDEKDRRVDVKREDGSREFLYSYYLSQEVDLRAFVGYKEEKKPQTEER